MMFNKKFYKSFRFWAGIAIMYTNRSIFTQTMHFNLLWIINVLIFIGAIYLFGSSLISKKEEH